MELEGYQMYNSMGKQIMKDNLTSS
jgi:hypothetical protein